MDIVGVAKRGRQYDPIYPAVEQALQRGATIRLDCAQLDDKLCVQSTRLVEASDKELIQVASAGIAVEQANAYFARRCQIAGSRAR